MPKSGYKSLTIPPDCENEGRVWFNKNQERLKNFKIYSFTGFVRFFLNELNNNDNYDNIDLLLGKKVVLLHA